MEYESAEGQSAPLHTYEQAVEWINGLIPFGIRPGLKRIEMLMELLEHPHRRLKFVHVAGTNGKGSTCAFLTNVLINCGYDVGTFTSPYITKFTNRFQYNNEDIPEETLLKLSNRLYPLVQQIAATELGSPTMFEVSTALAILYYAQECYPDVVVWETGLGGRMDVTNIVNPVVSVITNVGYDHTDILGDTLEQIAGEKAGIIKPGVPVVTSVDQPEVIQVMTARAEQCRSRMYLAGRDYTAERTGGDEASQQFHFQGIFRELDIEIGMQGEHQCTNAGLAMMTLEVLRQYMAFVLDDEPLLEGFRHTFWAGRLETVLTNPRIVLDGAHNPEGAASLVKSIPQTYTYNKLHFLAGMLENKQHEPVFRHLLSIADTLILTEPDFRRKMLAEHLLELVQRLQQEMGRTDVQVIVEKDWKQAIQLLQSQTEREDLGVVTGTLYLISDVRATLLHQTDSEKGW
ncbi:bifunctional folylpolyglutamate synthase/dihydrofolate synthase [Paenibacillus sp. WLX2291]|uniref:bifunctional folylpolyglutamate synthase/dihydrofolate synthase n=1 Tax=Paenibacillus sp. WLX2291 TaxID=3296934 RepID=UPI0039840958